MRSGIVYDYIIVGGGSAGCLLANRLSADGRHKVCLLEAGPADRSPFIKVPSGVIPLMRSKVYNWQFWTAPEPHMAQRRMLWPRGRTLGGSSSINAQVYIRGHAWDYDHWASLGNTGWGYADVLPYFKKSQNCEPGADAYNGQGGELNVAALRSTNPLSHAFVAAAQQAGIKPTADFNGAQQEGVGFYRVFQQGGERCSNARAFLRPAESRPNLTVITDAHATRVLFEGTRAVGVRYSKKGQLHDVRAAREVILSGGAINSPQLLLLSGVGPAEEIRPHGIELVHELPGVGKNLQDHLDVVVSVREKTHHAVTLNPMSLWNSIKALFQYIFGRRGMLTSNVAESGAFIKTAPSEPIPDLQVHFVPLAFSDHAQNLVPLFGYAYTIMLCNLRPRSTGQITLERADPLAPPRIHANYLADDDDLRRLVIAIRKGREILSQAAFAPHRGEELMPGPGVQTDEQIADWIRKNAETIYHPVGTCKMGVDDMAVVDPQLRVRGLQGLRVVDASVMPTVVGGNTNAPTTMIAEKGAEMILADAA
ncbi:MAG: choline dehydrogenase [Nevskiaceae bacterium]|nr:MAG: choline dehydrogenase [Nevskiaceae bacterium]